jgi:hypothetical protein
MQQAFISVILFGLDASVNQKILLVAELFQMNIQAGDGERFIEKSEDTASSFSKL